MIKRYRRTAVSQYLILGLMLITIISLGLISTIVMTHVQFEDQFAIPWAAGRAWLLEGVNPYTSTTATMASEAIGESGYLAAIPENEFLGHPLINLFLFLPFSLIPYAVSRALWMTLLFLCIGFIVYYAHQLSNWQLSTFKLIGLILLMIFWFPGVNAILIGSFSPIVILISLISLYLITQRQDTMGGFLLAFTFGALPITGYFLILLIIWSISHRRWSIISAYFSGVAFLLVISILMLPSWPVDWLRVMVNTYGNSDWIKTPLMTIAAILPGISNFLSLFLHAVFAIYLIVLWITATQKSGRIFVWKTSAVLVISLILNVQSIIPNLYLVLPAMFLVFRFWSERWGVKGKILSWMVVILAVFVPWLIVIPGINFNRGISLPLLTVGLPIFIFIGMNWIRWWAIKIPKLSDEFD